MRWAILLTMILCSIVVAAEPKNKKTKKAPLDPFSATPEQWAEVFEQQSIVLLNQMKKEMKPFDKDRNDAVDEELMQPYLEARYNRQNRATYDLVSSLLQRLDTDKDAKLKRSEIEPLLAEFRKLHLIASNKAELNLERHRIYLRHFDLDENHAVDEVEKKVGLVFERAAQVKGDPEDIVDPDVYWPIPWKEFRG